MEGRGYDTLDAAISEAAGTTAAITLMSDISLPSTITVSAPDTNITLTGSGTNYVITKDNNESSTFFYLEGSGGSFTLEGVTLQGGGVQVKSGAALVLKTGAKITGMTGSGMNGGGVYLDSDSVITKTGGTINGNTVYSRNNHGAEEVYVNCTGNPVRLENAVEAAHHLTKAADDDTADKPTSAKGWTE
ncbi:MAG: hypothetical protein LBP80_03895 [Treponema sp.]|jgi:hypothetical protein|nr:hypothetical protein [Treponema sp.]